HFVAIKPLVQRPLADAPQLSLARIDDELERCDASRESCGHVRELHRVPECPIRQLDELAPLGGHLRWHGPILARRHAASRTMRRRVSSQARGGLPERKTGREPATPTLARLCSTD